MSRTIRATRPVSAGSTAAGSVTAAIGGLRRVRRASARGSRVWTGVRVWRLRRVRRRAADLHRQQLRHHLRDHQRARRLLDRARATAADPGRVAARCLRGSFPAPIEAGIGSGGAGDGVRTGRLWSWRWRSPGCPSAAARAPRVRTRCSCANSTDALVFGDVAFFRDRPIDEKPAQRAA